MIFSQEKEFNQFRQEHKELRYFQALRQFIGADRILVEKNGEIKDTFYWQDLGIIKK